MNVDLSLDSSVKKKYIYEKTIDKMPGSKNQQSSITNIAKRSKNSMENKVKIIHKAKNSSK